MRSMTGGNITEEDKNLGFEVTAIGVMDEYNPQITALMELRGDISNTLRNSADFDGKLPPVEDIVANIDSVIFNKIQELKQNSIRYAEPVKDKMLSKEMILDKDDNGIWVVKVGDSTIETFGKDEYRKLVALNFIYERSSNEVK